MCGILGGQNFENLQKAIPLLMHRGPNEQSFHRFDDGFEFVHTRLSIVDIQHGHQPMFYGPLTIIFNGQIYNHEELKSRFKLETQTSSDTEVLLHLYEKMGDSMLKHLDGMFAFAIYNHDRREVFIARDRMGKKPLFVYREKDKFLFSSELNAAQSIVQDDIDHDRIVRYINRGFFFAEQTPYKHIDEFPPGSCGVYNCKTHEFSLQKWWDLSDEVEKRSDDSYSLALEKVEHGLSATVKRRLLSSDLEVGAFLSGGIDSGLVTAMASEFTNRLKTFTVRFDGQFDESTLAKKVSEKFGTHHTDIDISFDSLEADIDRIFGSYGEPIMDDSIIPSFYVSKAAKQHVTVILNGDGGDEIFGGYRRYIPFQYLNFLKKRAFPSLGNSSSARRSPLAFLQRLSDVARLPPSAAYLASTTDVSLFQTEETNVDGYGEHINEILTRNWSSVDKMLYLDSMNILPSVLLPKMDIATMQWSLEGRSPFLGKEILEYAPSLKSSYKVRRGTTKRILRDLAAKLLPLEISTQPKRGFEIPLEGWIDGIFKERINEILNSRNSFVFDFIDPSDLGLLNNVSEYKRAKILFMFLGLESWNDHRKKL